MGKHAIGFALAAVLALPASAQDTDRSVQPPEHTEPFPNLATGANRAEARKSFERAPLMQRDMDAKALLEQQRRLDAAWTALKAQRAGVMDTYVLTVALDSDPVFAREAREAAKVLARRYGGEGRTLALAGPDGVRDDLPQGNIRSFLLSLARIAEIMDPSEDVLVLYTTSHGTKLGLVNHYGNSGYGILSPAQLKATMKQLGFERRLLIISACYSGVFVPELTDRNTAILTAASAQRTSFGCVADNDWTFFGDALINNALRKPQSLPQASKEAARMIAGWEASRRLLASLPQTVIGNGAKDWIGQLEAQMPQDATQPVGRPSVGE